MPGRVEKTCTPCANHASSTDHESGNAEISRPVPSLLVRCRFSSCGRHPEYFARRRQHTCVSPFLLRFHFHRMYRGSFRMAAWSSCRLLDKPCMRIDIRLSHDDPSFRVMQYVHGFDHRSNGRNGAFSFGCSCAHRGGSGHRIQFSPRRPDRDLPLRWDHRIRRG